MIKNVLVVVAVLALIGGGYVWYTQAGSDIAPEPTVGTSTIEGRVTLSPTCPVESTPPDPSCAPKPYATPVSVLRGTEVVATMQTAENGSFTFKVAPGTYSVSASGGSPLPMCSEVMSVTIGVDEVKTVDISCDSGIR